MNTAEDVVVLGAGYAGLSAADALTRAGRKVIVVEARERVGGRTRTETTPDGLFFDYGAQWFGPGQDRAYALAARLGKSVFPMHVAGKNVLHLSGEARTYRGLIPFCLPLPALASLGFAFARLEWMARRIPLDAPYRARGAAELDATTFGAFIDRTIGSDQARFLVRVAAESVFAAHPDDVSLLHALFYLHSGGGLESLTSSQGGAQQDRVVGGIGGLAVAYADELRGRGVQFAFSSPVRAIAVETDGVEVHTDKTTLRARRVISTLPPVLAAELELRPGWSEERRAALAGLPPGCAMKCFAVYDRPFWREAGFSGSAVTDVAPVHVVFDVSPPDGSRGVLMGFIEGREALHWIDADASSRREAVVATFERCFGSQARDVRHYLEHEWRTDAYARGCYAGMAKPGYWTTHGRHLREPIGRLHFAGTETATEWNGYVEGAIGSGERVAREILKADGDRAPG